MSDEGEMSDYEELSDADREAMETYVDLNLTEEYDYSAFEVALLLLTSSEA